MRKSRSEIMVAVHSSTAPSQRLLRKAAQLARMRHANLHLAHIIASGHVPPVPSKALQQRLIRGEIARRRAQLEKLAASPLLENITVTCSVAWDYPVADALVRIALKRRPLMLLVQSRPRSALSRLWLTSTDWDLLRHCPCPVWIDRTARLQPQLCVLAALDPLHAHAKPATLDDAILEQALAVAGTARRVRVCHAYLPPRALRAPEGTVEGYYRSPAAIAEQRQHRAGIERLIAERLQQYGIPAAHASITDGAPAEQIVAAAHRTRADVLVMGAVSRSALKRMFIGHTAEHVLDHVSCDVLIVKPRRFKSPVERHTHVPRPLPLPPL